MYSPYITCAYLDIGQLTDNYPAIDSGSSDSPPIPRTEPCEYDSCIGNGSTTGHNDTRPDLNWINSFPVTAMKYGIDTFGPQLWNGSAPEFAVAGPNVGTNVFVQLP